VRVFRCPHRKYVEKTIDVQSQFSKVCVNFLFTKLLKMNHLTQRDPDIPRTLIPPTVQQLNTHRRDAEHAAQRLLDHNHTSFTKNDRGFSIERDNEHQTTVTIMNAQGYMRMQLNGALLVRNRSEALVDMLHLIHADPELGAVRSAEIQRVIEDMFDEEEIVRRRRIHEQAMVHQERLRKLGLHVTPVSPTNESKAVQRTMNQANETCRKDGRC
jgi:hypothetical protein